MCFFLSTNRERATRRPSLKSPMGLLSKKSISMFSDPFFTIDHLRNVPARARFSVSGIGVPAMVENGLLPPALWNSSKRDGSPK